MKGVFLFQIMCALAVIVGWVMNLIAVIHLATADAPLTTMFIVRIIGIPVGLLGAILGWF
ncbi:hypothetical protein [Mesorhizobium sp. M1403]|uniref:hypothetical protein n=1 Tax=Mesorhizobium sp. M1403 TaxID=2957097 RepID=UPI00333C9A49